MTAGGARGGARGKRRSSSPERRQNSSAGSWVEPSTTFANPAITIARSLSETFAGIAPAHVPPLILAQAIGAAGATALAPAPFPRLPPHRATMGSG
jgi:hypothetical protein